MNPYALIIVFVAIVILLVSWIRALITVWKEPSVKREHRVMWFLIMLFIGPSTIVYYAVTNQNKWGTICLISVLLIFLMPILLILIGFIFPFMGY